MALSITSLRAPIPRFEAGKVRAEGFPLAECLGGEKKKIPVEWVRMDGVAKALTCLPPSGMGWESRAACVERAGGKSIVSLQARCIPDGPNPGG